MDHSTAKITAAALFALIEPELEAGLQAQFYVSGMSMWPFIHQGRDCVIIRKADPSRLRIGDIILVRTGICEKYLLHRVTHINRNNRTFQTAGDGNCFYDGWFSMDAAAAVVTAIVYKGRQIPVTAVPYRILSTVWRLLFPIRRPLLKLLLKAAKWKHRL